MRVEGKPDYDAALEVVQEHYTIEENETPYNNVDYLGRFGGVSNALLYIEIFVPRFAVIEDSVLLDDGGPERLQDFAEAKNSTKMSLHELEVSYNYRELPYMFADRESTIEGCKVLAEFIAEAWRAHLLKSFPRRKFTVYIASHDTTEEDFYIQFEEIRENKVYLDG